MRHVPNQTARRSGLRVALALAVSALVLPGCVSGSKTAPDIADIVPADPRDGVAAGDPQAGTEDQAVVAMASQPADAVQPQNVAADMPAAANAPQRAGVVFETTGLKATSSSIFSSRPAGVLPSDVAPPPPAANATTPGGLYRSSPAPAQVLPLQPQPAQPIVPVQGAAATLPARGANIAAVPVAAKADPAAAIQVAGTRALPTQVTALGYSAFTGMRRRTMFATSDDASAEHDDKSPVVEMASLPGLARLAPNGLWLQTESVETGCFKPDLMQILKTVESHFGRKLLVTSGMRNQQHNRLVGGRPLSLHTSCQAADIQVPGVSKWDLAQYLRTLPGRGGVGTYCHTASVHIDVGRNRDWNWPCPPREV